MRKAASGWDMMMRSIFLFAVAAALSGCASMNTATSDQTARVQSAVYVANDATSATQPGSLKPVIKPVDAASPMAQPESRPVTIFWFLGGR
jgi:uncharacterized protein YceK